MRYTRQIDPPDGLQELVSNANAQLVIANTHSTAERADRNTASRTDTEQRLAKIPGNLVARETGPWKSAI